MKKKTLLALALTGALAGSSVGCYGQFALTKTVHTWNGSFHNKFVQTLLFWGMVIIPVYEVAGLADAIVLNVIEFWSGSNPMSGGTAAGPMTAELEHGGRTYRFERVSEDEVHLFVDGQAGGIARITADGGLAFSDLEHGRSLFLSPEEMIALNDQLAPR